MRQDLSNIRRIAILSNLWVTHGSIRAQWSQKSLFYSLLAAQSLNSTIFLIDVTLVIFRRVIASLGIRIIWAPPNCIEWLFIWLCSLLWVNRTLIQVILFLGSVQTVVSTLQLGRWTNRLCLLLVPVLWMHIIISGMINVRRYLGSLSIGMFRFYKIVLGKWVLVPFLNMVVVIPHVVDVLVAEEPLMTQRPVVRERFFHKAVAVRRMWVENILGLFIYGDSAHSGPLT